MPLSQCENLPSDDDIERRLKDTGDDERMQAKVNAASTLVNAECGRKLMRAFVHRLLQVVEHNCKNELASRPTQVGPR